MKRRRFWNWPRLSVVLLAAVSLAAPALSGPGYLALVGPSPLRFFPPFRAVTNRFVLPAPVPPPAPASAATQAEKPPASPLLPAAPSAPPPPAGQTPADSGLTQRATESTPPETVIPPQMFLKFFSKSTNGGASSPSASPAPSTTPALTPLGFTPPKAPGPPASSATYSTGP